MSGVELLVVMVPVARCDEVVDALIALEEVAGFTRSRAAGFGREHSHFSLRESVQGYLDQERFELICEHDQVDGVLETVRALAGRDRFFYWVSPLTRSGRLGTPASG